MEKFTKIFFNQDSLVGLVHEDGFVCVHRIQKRPALSGDLGVSEHVADKLPSQDWREVRLPNVSAETRRNLIEAHKRTTRPRHVVQGGSHDVG